MLFSDWFENPLFIWLENQFLSVIDQAMALTISAIAGGLISWSITRQSDRKARIKQAERDELARLQQTERDENRQQAQELRDQRRNLFEYRRWRAMESAGEEKLWNVSVDTSPWYRYNWVLSISPKSKTQFKAVCFHIGSIIPGKGTIELTNQFASRSQKVPPLGVKWVHNNHHMGHWESDGSELCYFTFDIGKIIDDADGLEIHFETEDGVKRHEFHLFFPFDTMLDFRPWEVIQLKDDD